VRGHDVVWHDLVLPEQDLSRMAHAGAESAADGGADLPLTRSGRQAGGHEGVGGSGQVQQAGADELAELEGGAVEAVVALAG
jgi:hypothetical protein